MRRWGDNAQRVGTVSWVIVLTPEARERVEAFVEGRAEHPLFTEDVAGAFTEDVAAAWVAEQTSGNGRWRIIDPREPGGHGALIVAAFTHDPPRSPWESAVAADADLSLYRRGLAWRGLSGLPGGSSRQQYES